MKKLTKLLSAALVVMMVASSVASAVTITPSGGAVAFGTEPTMMVNYIGANRSVDGVLTTKTDNDTVAGFVGYAGSGLVKFTFDEDMDVDTLNSDNIKIFAYAPKNINNASADYTTFGLKDSSYNSDGSVIYQPLKKSAREFVLWIGDFGIRAYRVTFTTNVKTAAGTAITEQKFVFRVGKNAKMPYREGKKIVELSYNKPAIDQAGATKTTTSGANITGNPINYSANAGNAKIAAGGWWKVDLGNIYEVGDVVMYDAYNPTQLNTNTIEVYYSSDPNAGFGADQVVPTLWGEVGTAYKPSSADKGSDNESGVNGDRWLNPENTVYARYIFVKNLDGTNANVEGLNIFGYVDDYYTTLTAEQNGSTYTVKAPVLDFMDNGVSAYMIVAGYDADGVVTTIKCDSVDAVDGFLSMDATMESGTTSVKAALIESFANPYLLTDALVISAQ